MGDVRVCDRGGDSELWVGNMLNTHIEGTDDFQQEVVFSSDANLAIRDQTWEVIQETSKHVRTLIQMRMPVEYGDAAGRWGNPSYTMKRPRYGGAAGQGIWQEDRLNMAITQGAELEPYEYIERLNEGSSTQAPAGFIDTAAEEGIDRMTDGLLDAIVHVWTSNDVGYGRSFR